jgi:hypothetical protein
MNRFVESYNNKEVINTQLNQVPPEATTKTLIDRIEEKDSLCISAYYQASRMRMMFPMILRHT